MRRVLAIVLSLVALLALGSPDAFAQAPTSKVTINGLIDNITSYTRNMSNVDLNYSHQKDTEWYARTRVRPDITGEVGTTKFVLGLEIDATWGQTGGQDTSICIQACPAAGTNTQRAGTTGGWDSNTDLQGTLELKWAYTEFDLPGLPFASRVRLGAQPWGTAATYKLAAYANGDFAGVHVNIKPVPEVALLLTYGQLEEESTGHRDFFFRGEDWVFIASAEFTPFKGLDVKPMYSLFHATGTTAGSARTGKGGLGTGALGGIGTGAGAPYYNGAHENRHTFGVDARLRMGPFSLDPTLLYQIGTREIVDPVVPAVFRRRATQDEKSWLIDIRGGFQTGPLLIEGAGIWTPGNKANHDIRNPRTEVRYYQPVSTDTSYYAGWAEHFALGLDYFNIIHNAAGGINPGVSIGYDKYGLIRVGARVSYNVTPAFTVRAAWTSNWTDEKVDVEAAGLGTGGAVPLRGGTTKTAGAGITPTGTSGDERYLGTEFDLGFQWRFAPGITFDVVGAYTFAGDALGAGRTTNTNSAVVRTDTDVKDIQTVTARLRFNF